MDNTIDNEKNKLNLQLGDIIQIDSPSNVDLHDKIYFINFINHDKIVLINEDKIITLSISEDGKLLEESIENILLLNRQDSASYVVQNNLSLNKIISIYFGEPLPRVINGVITNIEEDMIEITLTPNSEVLYIDFAYSGIPENLNIEKIIIRDKSEISEKILKEQEEEADIDEEGLESVKYLDLDNKDDLDYDLVNYPTEENLNKILLDSIEFGEDLEEIYHNVNVPEDERRYSLEDQLNDYINIMINNTKQEYIYI